MIATLSFKNLLHDRVRFVVTVVGIGLSLILVIVQLGLLSGFDQSISGMLDHAKADLWIVPRGTVAFDDPVTLDRNHQYAALKLRDVRRVSPVTVGFAEWRRKTGESTTVIVVGSDPKSGVLVPWNIVHGNVKDLRAPATIAIDASYSDQLGFDQVGDLVQIEGHPARIAVVTNGIRSFTTSPYVFTSYNQAAAFLNLGQSRASYLAVELMPGADISQIQKQISQRLPNAETLTTEQFRHRNLLRWLLETGAGFALLAGASLAVIVGIVVMTQSLYSSINERRREFATLRAMGSSRAFLRAVVGVQALFTVAAGGIFAAFAGTLIALSTAGSSMPIQLTPTLVLAASILALMIGAASVFMASRKIVRVDPASVFAQ
jgi:putative ABC transport system permease protein